MTLQQLVYFLAVAGTGNFTRAAEQTHVAQPSLSKQIQNLESELGAPLLHRARGRIALTAAGEALLPVAERILADVDTARTEVADLAGLRRGRVRIGATPSLSVSVLAEVLRRFHDRRPGIALVVREGGSRDLTAALLRGDLDLALVIEPPQGLDPALDTTPLLSEELVIATAAGAQPARAVPLTWLRTRNMVMFGEGYDLRETTLHACRQAGFEPKLAVDGGEMDAVLRFVETGLGAAIVPSMVLAGRPSLGSAALTPPLHRTVALAHRGDITLSAATGALRATLTEYLGDAATGATLPRGTRLANVSGGRVESGRGRSSSG